MKLTLKNQKLVTSTLYLHLMLFITEDHLCLCLMKNHLYLFLKTNYWYITLLRAYMLDFPQ